MVPNEELHNYFKNTHFEPPKREQSHYNRQMSRVVTRYPL